MLSTLLMESESGPLVWQLMRGHRPALLVDATTRVRALNPEMERLLGWRSEELAGRRLLAASVAPIDWSGVRDLLDAALHGRAAAGELVLMTRAGRRVAMRADLAREVRGRTRTLAVVASETRELDVVKAGDCWCEASRTDGEAKALIRSLRFLDPDRDGAPYIGKPLATLLEELGSASAASWTDAVLEKRASEWADVVVTKPDGAFRLVTVQSVDDVTVRLVIRCIEARLLPELVDAKVLQVAEACGLSDRERQVLKLLLHGRSVEDIATMLEIAPRTVKFHQANVLQKLGADSRFDLLRVVL